MRRTRTASTVLFALLTLSVPAGSALPAAAQEPAPSQAAQDLRAEQRARILAIAERYASFRWRGGPANALHGEDADGRRVDTPDTGLDPAGWSTDGEENVGMPYAWGGFTTIEEFECGLAEGKLAGHVPRTERAMPSRHAMGLDCSGFVARAWDLPYKQSTRSLGALCYELGGYDALQPGDIANKFDSHVVLFVGFEDEARTRVRVLEAARLRVKESVYDVATLERSGFVPMRYKPLDDRWIPMELGAPSLAAEPGARGRFRRTGEGPELAGLPNSLADAASMEWARYRAEDEAFGTLDVTRMVARVAEGAVEVQVVEAKGGHELMRGATWRASAPLADALLDFAGFLEPFRGVQVVTSSVEEGTYALAGRELPARRVSALLEGSLLVRHALHPVTVELECVLSDAVPLQGVLEARYAQEVTWGETDDGDTIVSRVGRRFALEACGGLAGGEQAGGEQAGGSALDAVQAAPALVEELQHQPRLGL